MNVLEFDELSGKLTDGHAAAVRKYLTSNGWVYTSRHPGSVWMWSINMATEITKIKTVATDYVVNEATAIRIQRYWEMEEQHFVGHDAECAIFETFKWDDCNCILANGPENDTAALDGEE